MNRPKPIRATLSLAVLTLAAALAGCGRSQPKAAEIPEARPVIERYLKMGALGIGEQKFPVEADSPHIDLVAAIAREHGVPVLMHFEH